MSTWNTDFAKSPDWRQQERVQRNVVWLLYFVVEIILIFAFIGFSTGH